MRRMNAATASSAPARPSGPWWTRRWVKALGALALLLALLVALFDWNWVRPLVVNYLSKTSQREIRVDDLQVSFSPTLAPTIRLRGVHVPNPAWADRPTMANVGEVIFEFDNLATLFDEQSLVARLVLKDADVDLERQADGLRNWRLREPEYRGPGKYLIQRVESYNSSLRVAHRGLGLDVSMHSSHAAGALPNRIVFSGNYQGSAFTGEVVTPPVFSLQRTDEFFPLRGHARAGATQFEIDGRMADFIKIGAVDAQIKVSGPSMAQLHPYLRGRPPDSHAYHAQGHLNIDQSVFGFDHFRAVIGSTDVAGAISLSRSGRRVWQASLRSENAQMADLTSLSFNPTPADPHGPAQPPAAKPAPGHILPVKRLATERLQYDDAYVTLAIDKLNDPAIPALQGLRVTADLQEGVLTLAPLDIAIAGGHATGKIVLDGKPHPAVASVNLTVRDVQLSQLVARVRDAGGTSAPLSARLNLRGSGESVAALLGSATGSAQVSMAPGRISNLLDAMLGLNAGKVVWLKLAGDRDIALNCASAAIDFRNGVGTSRRLLLDTAQTRASGNATIDLRQERFDLTLTPQAKESRLFALGSAIHAQGSFTQAGYKIEKGEAASRDTGLGSGCATTVAQGPAASAIN